jgi:hypothetical protein
MTDNLTPPIENVRSANGGRSMSESHKHLKVTESEWAAFCKDSDDTLAKLSE